MTYSPTMMRFMEADPEGYVDGPDDYLMEGANPVNRLDPTGCDEIDDATAIDYYSPEAPPIFGGEYPYLPLPGAKFSGSIQANTLKSLKKVEALATISFVPPANTLSRCSEIKIIQVLTYESWNSYDIFNPSGSSSWEVDNDGLYTQFYPYPTNWWDSRHADATFTDQPGDMFFPTIYHEEQDFRDYAVATAGPDKGHSFGYFEWGHEWTSGNPGYERIWMGTKQRKIGNGMDGKYGQAISFTAPPQNPIPGGVTVTPNYLFTWKAKPI